MKIEYRNPIELIPYIHNAKEHPSSQIDKIASSIKEFGFDVPIVITADNSIVKGHGRVLAAKKLGLDRVPVIIREDLSDVQVRASRLADNKVAESNWLEEELKLELETLADLNLDLSLTGFDIDELENLSIDIDNDANISRTDPENDNDDVIDSRWDILLSCKDEDEQQKLLLEFMEREIQCRALIS